MKRTQIILCLTLLIVCVLYGCEAKSEADATEGTESLIEALDETLEPEISMPVAEVSDEVTDSEAEMQIKVTDGTNEIIFKLNDSSVSTSLYEQLPLTLDVENYSSNEKIFYPPEKLDASDVIEGDGPTGTLAYFSPWGNVVMYYSSFSAYPGLYIMGEATKGSESIENLSGTITIVAE